VNTIDFAIGELNGAPTPDLPWLISHTFGEGPANYGLTNGGDSGGPALIGTSIIGVASFGDLPRPCTTPCTDPFPAGRYINGHANLAEDVTGNWVADFISVPEPGSWALAAGGLALLLLSRGQS
jgi:hypothetical protein